MRIKILIKQSLRGNSLIFQKHSLNYMLLYCYNIKGNVWRLVWGICMWILELKSV